MSKPRAYTKEEMREMFLDQCRAIARYWSNTEDNLPIDKCNGVAFSILNLIDGMSGGFPADISLMMEPHPDDKDYNISNDDNFVEPGQIINDDIMLHDQYYNNRS